MITYTIVRDWIFEIPRGDIQIHWGHKRDGFGCLTEGSHPDLIPQWCKDFTPHSQALSLRNRV